MEQNMSNTERQDCWWMSDDLDEYISGFLTFNVNGEVPGLKDYGCNGEADDWSDEEAEDWSDEEEQDVEQRREQEEMNSVNGGMLQQ